MSRNGVLKLLLTAVVFLVCGSAAAQRTTYYLEDLPQVPMDTVDTDRPNVKIITYTNNTWRYLYTDYSQRANQKVFQDHWVTNGVFAYRDVNIADVPESMEI